MHGGVGGEEPRGFPLSRLAHRIREGWSEMPPSFEGVVEIDETFVGGLEKNKHGPKKIRNRKRNGEVVIGDGKTVVIGARERATKRFCGKHHCT